MVDCEERVLANGAQLEYLGDAFVGATCELENDCSDYNLGFLRREVDRQFVLLLRTQGA